MATSYPGGLDSFTNPTATDSLNSATVPHATQHANANDAIEAIQAELGTDPAGASLTVKARFEAIEAAGWVTSTRILDGTIVDGDINASAAIAPSKINGTAVVDSDARLTDARTPTAHAASHASAGSDPITIAQSQVTSLESDLAGKAPTAVEAVAVGYAISINGYMNASQNAGHAGDEMRLWPCWSPQAGTYSSIAMRVATAAATGALWRLGVYADNNGQPGALIADCGTIDPTTTGQKIITGLSIALPYGRFWAGFAQQGSSTVQGAYYSGVPTVALQPVSTTGTPHTFVRNTAVSGALPDPAGCSSGTNTTFPPAIQFVRSA